jgi:hypothetical protein
LRHGAAGQETAPLGFEQALQAAHAITDASARSAAFLKIAVAQADAGQAEAARLGFEHALEAAGQIARS